MIQRNATLHRRGRGLQDFQRWREEFRCRTGPCRTRSLGRARALAPVSAAQARCGRRLGSASVIDAISDRLALEPPQIGVEAAGPPHQFRMRADFDDAPVDDADDPVAAAHGGEPVGDDDDRAVPTMRRMLR